MDDSNEDTGLFAALVQGATAGAPIPAHGLRRLQRFLSEEMRRRGLHELPPSFLGDFDRAEWSEDAIAALACEAWDYCLVARRKSLLRKMAEFQDIDGLVRLNVKHFLTHRQARSDPSAYALFCNLKEAALDLRNRGKLRYASVKRAAPSELIEVICAPQAPPVLPPLDELASFDEGLEILRALGRRSKASEAQAARLLESEIARGRRTFSLAQITRALVEPVRVAGHPVWLGEETAYEWGDDDRPGELVLVARAHEEMGNQVDFAALVTRIRAAIAALPSGSAQRGVGRLFEESLAIIEMEDWKSVGTRELSRRLGIARSTAYDHLRLLRQVIEGLNPAESEV